MDSGFLWFLLGALVSIPISVLSPFATRKVEQRRARRNKERAELRSKQLQEELARIRGFAQDRSLLTSYLVGQILLITVIIALGTLLSGLAFAAANIIGATGAGSTPINFIAALGGVLNIGTISIALPIGLRALRIRERADNLKNYEQIVDAELIEIGVKPGRVGEQSLHNLNSDGTIDEDG
jgi:hypothetical protein